VPILALTGGRRFAAGRQATVVLDASSPRKRVRTLAPTASTTVALALGDALAVTLLEVKGFRREISRRCTRRRAGRKLLLRDRGCDASPRICRLLTPEPPDAGVHRCCSPGKRGTVVIVEERGKQLLAS